MKKFFLFSFLFYTVLVLGQNYFTQKININKGLFSNNINKIYIDSEGSLWLGSRAGLAVKKSDKFKLVDEAQIYKFNNIFDIVEDADRGIWAASYGLGVLYLGDNLTRVFNYENGLISNFVRNLTVIDDEVFVGTKDGLAIISAKDLTVKNINHNNNKSDHSFTIVSVSKFNDTIYVATLNDGIYKLKNDKLELVKTFSSHRINFVKKAGDKLLMSTSVGLYVLNNTDLSIIESYDLPDVWEFIIDNDRILLLASSLVDFVGGIYELKNNNLNNISEKYYLSSIEYKSFAYDKVLKKLYIASNEDGLFLTQKEGPIKYKKFVERIDAIKEIEDKKYVFHENGLTIYDKDKELKSIPISTFKQFQKDYQLQTVNQKKIFDLLPFNPNSKGFQAKFYEYLYVHENYLWIATTYGIFKLDLNGTIVSYIPLQVYFFYINNGEFIAPIPYNGTIVIHNLDSLDFTYHPDFLGGNPHPTIPQNIVDMAITPKAVYFASALEGVYQYKNGVFKSWKTENWFKVNKIRRITTTQNNELIIVSDFNDIYIFDISQPIPALIKTIDYKKIKGASTQYVESVNNILYVGTNLGINVFYKDKYFFIDKEQGFNNNDKTKATVQNDKVYILSSQGYYIIDNNYFIEDRFFNPEIKLSRLIINNDNQNLKSNPITALSLAHDKNNLLIEFDVNNVKFPNKLIYYYQLQSQSEWIEVNNDRIIYLPYLAPGNYNINIKVHDLDSGKTIEKSLISIKINEAFYQSWWFTVLVLVVVLGIVFFLFRNYKVKKQKEQENDKKEIQLLNLNHQVFRGQLKSHFIYNVLSSIQYFIYKKDTEKAMSYFNKFASLIRKTLDSSDNDNVSLLVEFEYLEEYIEIANLGRDIPIDFIIDCKDNIDTEQTKMIPSILQPFIENSIIHAFPDEIILNPAINLNVTKYNYGLKFELIDNGVGINKNKSSLHQSKGISIVKRRLEINNKRDKNAIVISSSDQGTRVTIYYENSDVN